MVQPTAVTTLNELSQFPISNDIGIKSLLLHYMYQTQSWYTDVPWCSGQTQSVFYRSFAAKKKVNKLQVIWDCYHVTCHLGVAQNKNVFLTLLYHHHLNISVWVLLQHVQNAQSDCMRPTTCATECVPVHFQHQQWLQSWPVVTDTLLLVCHCDVFSSICNPKEI